MTDEPNARFPALFREHPALIASGFYVFASFVGMFWSWAYLRRFGINVFNYAQISDFLLASLKEPFTWMLVMLAFAMVQADNAWSRRVDRRAKTTWFRWYGSPTYRMINNFGAIALICVFIFTYATLEARDTRDGKGETVDVIFAEGGAVKRATLLGTTSQFMFLYEPTTERVDIHPFEAIHSISFQAD
ncbi:MAG TPA: hypothetical protein VLA11_07900 [Woeseiaceae bacterium]|jgi:hypothetical protein|nr:hypothetical protein [Woeseiaceae bacterium]